MRRTLIFLVITQSKRTSHTELRNCDSGWVGCIKVGMQAQGVLEDLKMHAEGCWFGWLAGPGRSKALAGAEALAWMADHGPTCILGGLTHTVSLPLRGANLAWARGHNSFQT